LLEEAVLEKCGQFERFVKLKQLWESLKWRKAECLSVSRCRDVGKLVSGPPIEGHKPRNGEDPS
jgi:hypothetical protein